MRHLVQHHRRFVALPAALVCCASLAGAQQFQQVTTFPGAALWSEGVECADVDQDGDLDVFVADGDGFASAGTQRAQKLFINQTVQGTPYGLVDESTARLGTNLATSKGVTSADVNGDGWVDALFTNAFFNDPPFLYINQGVPNPGFFTLESATRGFTVNLSSGGAAFADLDDDGDLDVIINDRYNSGTTGRPHLYFNNGVGVFTENAAALNAPLKNQQMDVQLADIDGDWDIDFFGSNKATAMPAQYLMTNSGTGSFTDVSSLLTQNSGAVYEAELGDLDGDNDLDLFYTSMAGFAEGSVRNNQVPNGSLTFTNQATFGGDDDNEIALIDFDNDGDYDAHVGSLGAAEKMYRNDGSLVWVNVSGATIQVQGDSTLDSTFADLNNDGKYDLITVQGESGNFTDKYYKNTGGSDTRAPVITAELFPASAPAANPLIVKAKVRDQVLDDGVNYVTGAASYVVLTAPSSAAIAINPGAFSPNTINVTAGTTLTWTNASGVAQDVTSALFASGAIANGGTFARTFVKPGTYAYSSVAGGGFAGSVTVTGPATEVAGLNQGGQQYRFKLNDPPQPSGALLCYELRFTDWPGNTSSASRCITLTGGAPGAAFCFGDGSGTACPCGNNASLGSGTGCLNSLALGGRLQASGTASIANDTLVLAGSGMPNSSALYFQGTAQVAGGAGSVFGDGLRCATTGVIRLGTKINAAGASQYPVGGDPSISIRGANSAGNTRTYQVWYRNAAAFCAVETFNLTNGWQLTWTP